MKPQDSYYVLVGRRYLRWPQAWLRKYSKEHHGIVARSPLPDCALSSMSHALTVVQNIRNSKDVDGKFKKSLSLQHVHVREMQIPHP